MLSLHLGSRICIQRWRSQTISNVTALLGSFSRPLNVQAPNISLESRRSPSAAQLRR